MGFGNWDLERDKAPRFDGFSIHFYHFFWSIIKYDSFQMLNWSRKKPKLVGGTHSSFLSLIPKENNSSSFTIF